MLGVFRIQHVINFKQNRIAMVSGLNSQLRTELWALNALTRMFDFTLQTRVAKHFR